LITVDSNVLVYIYDGFDPARQGAALEIFQRLTAHRAPVARQVIGELYDVLHRKLRRPAGEAAHAARTMLAAFELSFPASEQAVEDALAHAAAGRCSYWDALLTASARDAGCLTLISEDMHPGNLLSIEIVKPFDVHGRFTDRIRELLELDP
jgi:predicted nucleic acid-binding protein